MPSVKSALMTAGIAILGIYLLKTFAPTTAASLKV